MTLLELFCDVDDFTQTYQAGQPKNSLPDSKKTRNRKLSMDPSEIMTLLIWFHSSSYRTFKDFYLKEVKTHLAQEFPNLPSYNRFVEWMPRCILPLIGYLFSKLGNCSGVTFVDSTPLKVCHNARISAHKVFTGLAARGRTSVGWFYGFKLHLLVNEQGELLWFALTAGNTDDRKGLLKMLKCPECKVFGKLFGDKGYISQDLMSQLLKEHKIQLITRLKKNMHTNKPMLKADQLFLRKRAIIESIIDQLKNISQIEHSRHRSPQSFLVNLLCGLIMYCQQPKKPSLSLHKETVLAA